jgi:hypothetical protein
MTAGTSESAVGGAPTSLPVGDVSTKGIPTMAATAVAPGKRIHAIAAAIALLPEVGAALPMTRRRDGRREVLGEPLDRVPFGIDVVA